MSVNGIDAYQNSIEHAYQAHKIDDNVNKDQHLQALMQQFNAMLHGAQPDLRDNMANQQVEAINAADNHAKSPSGSSDDNNQVPVTVTASAQGGGLTATATATAPTADQAQSQAQSAANTELGVELSQLKAAQNQASGS